MNRKKNAFKGRICLFGRKWNIEDLEGMGFSVGDLRRMELHEILREVREDQNPEGMATAIKELQSRWC